MGKKEAMKIQSICDAIKDVPSENVFKIEKRSQHVPANAMMTSAAEATVEALIALV